MRIGVNCFLLQPSVGGIKQYFFNLFHELLKKDDQHEYIFFHFPHNAEELKQMENTRWQDHAILLHDQMEIKCHLDKIDLYFCPFGSLWPRPLPIPTVVTLVDIQEVFYPENFTGIALFNRAYHYGGSTKMADRVLTISEFSKKTIVKSHRLSPKKVIVAHLCADERFYRAMHIAHPLQAPLPDGDFIFYPANHWHHKNHDSLLRALQWLKRERGLRINVVFTGYDNVPNNYPLVQKVSEYGLDGQVFYVGYVSIEELAYLYTRAKMMVFPSLFEGFGIPVVEAMIAGCPVVASNVTSLPEVGGDVVEYFDPLFPESIGSAIERVWKNENLRQQLIVKGRQRASHFSAANLAHVHLTGFQEAAQSFSQLRYAWNYWVYQRYHFRKVHWKYRKVL
ncbi:glycosyl transferase group 1 [Candidatus Vecturithrix granuli]|uniref:Glycosyl transferase group 1 n=1 Tax=Vecturithrix granuli TaxID=1499967 RepID=A0A081BW76_VECG1|nr:glycosyl transferase group 1 [Candidatus Vecturithrix granuli]